MAKAYVLIVNESGTDDSVIASLKQIQSITNAYGTFGTYDIITKLESTDSIIHHDITKVIRKIPKIRSTLTLLVDRKPGISKINETESKILEEYTSKAYIVIRCLKSDEETILQKLDEIPEVIEADMVVGSYDIICKVSAPTYNDISEIISKKIRKIPEIKSTITINVINNQGFNR